MLYILTEGYYSNKSLQNRETASMQFVSLENAFINGCTRVKTLINQFGLPEGGSVGMSGVDCSTLKTRYKKTRYK